jgi:hypothetical protein
MAKKPTLQMTDASTTMLATNLRLPFANLETTPLQNMSLPLDATTIQSGSQLKQGKISKHNSPNS